MSFIYRISALQRAYKRGSKGGAKDAGKAAGMYNTAAAGNEPACN